MELIERVPTFDAVKFTGLNTDELAAVGVRLRVNISTSSKNVEVYCSAHGEEAGWTWPPVGCWLVVSESGATELMSEAEMRRRFTPTQTTADEVATDG